MDNGVWNNSNKLQVSIGDLEYSAGTWAGDSPCERHGLETLSYFSSKCSVFVFFHTLSIN